MFYKFDINGIYCGTSKNEVEYSTSVAPPDANETATWVWNHYDWVAMPLGWTPVQAEYIPPVVEETPTEQTTPVEETPSA